MSADFWDPNINTDNITPYILKQLNYIKELLGGNNRLGNNLKVTKIDYNNQGRRYEDKDKKRVIGIPEGPEEKNNKVINNYPYLIIFSIIVIVSIYIANIFIIFNKFNIHNYNLLYFLLIISIIILYFLLSKDEIIINVTGEDILISDLTKVNVTKTIILTLGLIFIFKFGLVKIDWSTIILIGILLYTSIYLISLLIKSNNISTFNFNKFLAIIGLQQEITYINNNIIYLLTLAIITLYLFFYKYFKRILHWFILPDYKNISDKQIYLDSMHEYEITNFNDKHNFNYAISSWIYINPQPSSTKYSYNKYTSLLNYGDKPNIMYKSDINELKIVMLQGTNNIVTIHKSNDLLLQKWNHFVINYSNNNLDIFLNNKLIASKQNITPVMDISTISSGEEYGIEGGIRDIKYFYNPLKRWQISYLYNSNQ